MREAGLSRTEAAAFVTKRTGHYVPHTTLRHWELTGFMRAQSPGRRRPANYTVPDLVAACMVAELREKRVPLQRVRKAMHELFRLMPDLRGRPGAWRLAVTERGQVVRVNEGGRELLELTNAPGQTGWVWVWECSTVTREAELAVQRDRAA